MAAGAYSGVVSPESTRDLLTLAAEFKEYGPVTTRRLEDAGRSQLTAAWTEELGKRSGISVQQESIVKAFPDVAVSGASVAAGTGGQGKLGFLTRQFEFGADRELFKPVRARGTSYERRTRRQLPGISARGWIAYPAAGSRSERVYKLYLAIVVKVAHDMVEGNVRG